MYGEEAYLPIERLPACVCEIHAPVASCLAKEMIKSAPEALIAKGTDWRFLNELKNELKA